MIHTNYKELVGYSEELILNCILVLFEYTRDVKLIEGIGIIKNINYRFFQYKNCKSFSEILNLLGVKLDEGIDPIFEYGLIVFTISLVVNFNRVFSDISVNNKNIKWGLPHLII